MREIPPSGQKPGSGCFGSQRITMSSPREPNRVCEATSPPTMRLVRASDDDESDRGGWSLPERGRGLGTRQTIRERRLPENPATEFDRAKAGFNHHSLVPAGRASQSARPSLSSSAARPRACSRSPRTPLARMFARSIGGPIGCRSLGAITRLASRFATAARLEAQASRTGLQSQAGEPSRSDWLGWQAAPGGPRGAGIPRGSRSRLEPFASG